ncbi:MAG: N-acetyltransferase [Deltaproteobacteria bacterium]|nr:N-acetyltransferase [Deltaproteobacteria bacterium]
MIRKAVTKEVKSIHKLLVHYAGKGALLPRSLSELYDHLRDLFVLVDGSDHEEVFGVCALGVCWEELAEIRSLAVAETYHGEGFGRQLVERCLEEAGELGLSRIFALTYVPKFFEKMGFQEIDKSILPHKIWADCLKCPKFPDCDEIAMMLDLS